MTTELQNMEAHALACPFAPEACRDYYDELGKISARLQQNSQAFYCAEQYRHCARYHRMLCDGRADVSVAPWDTPSPRPVVKGNRHD